MAYLVAAGCAVLFAIAFAAAWPLLGRLDNELGADMPDRQHRLRDAVRRWIGTKALPNHLANLEEHMTTMLELLTGLTAKTTEASAAQQASFLNLHNAVDKLTGNVARLEQLVRDGEASEELQALAVSISENLGDMKKAAETADDGFEPVETPGDELPEDALPETPGDETPTEPVTPVEDVPVDAQPVADESTARRR